MKKILLLTTFMAALMAGCQRDLPGHEGEEGASGALKARFAIPEASPATRAAISPGTIRSLWVMVFNENGNYLSRHRGVPSESDPSSYTFPDVPVSGAARTLHFVANFDWTGFPDMEMNGRSENEVVRGMNVALDAQGRPTVAYWQRVTLPDGLDGVPGTTMNLPGTIGLLRNVAQITVTNGTADATNGLALTDVQFAVGDYPDKGSVAPFDTRAGSFGVGNPTDDFVTEALGTATSAIGEDDFVAAQNGGGGASSGAFEVYERRNSAAADQTFVIVKGLFQNGGPVNESVWSYYKIDICEDDATTLLDIRRNYRYMIDLKLVSHAGYPTLAEAVENAAANNINASVTVSEYTAVSDGANVLRIENSSFIYVKPGQPFEIRYAYIEVDGSTGATDNTGVRISLDQDDRAPVVADGTFGYTTVSSDWTGGRRGAVIRGTTAALPERFDIHRATINISKGALSRTIHLQLRPAMDFVDVKTTPADGIVHNGTGEHVTISFKMPADISPSLFPIPVYITTKRFSPDASRTGLSVDVAGGDYRYVYYAPWQADANGRPLAHTVYLVSNSPNTDETVTLSADMFNDSRVRFGNGSHPVITNLAATPDGEALAARAGEPVALTFDVPSLPAASHTFRIFTSKLDFVSTPTGTDCVWDPETECWVYTTENAGTQTINFRTNAVDSSETVRVSSTGFSSASLVRNCDLLDFTPLGYTPAVAPRAAGEAVDISFGIPAKYDWGAGRGVCEVSFYTRSLTPLDGGGSLEPISDPVYGTGYRLKVAEAQAAGIVTARFRTLYANNDIRATVVSTGFNTTVITAARVDWDFTASFSRKPREISDTTTPTILTFSLPEGSVSASEPVTVTFAAPYLALVTNDDAERSPELAGDAIRSSGANANVVMTMRVTTPGPHRFRVRNSSSQFNNRQTTKRLRATYFDEKSLNNPTGN